MPVKKDTYDNKKLLKHYGLRDVDEAFKNWWTDTLNISIKGQDGTMQKVPAFFISSERWNKARDEGGIRDDKGTIILPLIAISRPGTSSPVSGPYARNFADIKRDHVVAKKLSPKSSLVKKLVKENPDSMDPAFPIYEVYTAPVPDHYNLTYEVAIWTAYMADANEIIEKIGQQMDYKSVKSFQFETPAGTFFTAFQEEDFENETNLEDFTDSERIIQFTTSFNVSAHVYTQSNQRPENFKRYFSQTKVVVKTETEFTEEEEEEFFGKK